MNAMVIVTGVVVTVEIGVVHLTDEVVLLIAARVVTPTAALTETA